MGQIIKSVCVCQSVCQCVSVSASTLTVAFLDRIGTDVRTPKSKNEFVGVNIASPLPVFCPQNPHFRSRGPENPCKY